MENKVMKRTGEMKESPYRSGRFYTIGNDWFFSVREVEEQGPYFSKLSAEIGLKMYLLDIEAFDTSKIKSATSALKMV